MPDFSDSDLREHIEQTLEDDPTIDVSRIHVSVKDGVVTLQGTVESRDDRKWIEVLVRQVPGISDVVNYLAPDESDFYQEEPLSP